MREFVGQNLNSANNHEPIKCRVIIQRISLAGELWCLVGQSVRMCIIFRDYLVLYFSPYSWQLRRKYRCTSVLYSSMRKIARFSTHDALSRVLSRYTTCSAASRVVHLLHNIMILEFAALGSNEVVFFIFFYRLDEILYENNELCCSRTNRISLHFNDANFNIVNSMKMLARVYLVKNSKLEAHFGC